MNRKIELRAFDNVFKKMYYSTFEQFDDMAGFRFDHFEDDSDLIYMQKTPFKDIDGKAVWEGDILKLFYLPKLIYWNNIKGQFEVSNINKDNSFREEEAIPAFNIFKTAFELKIVVIGNIHENKELLNERTT